MVYCGALRCAVVWCDVMWCVVPFCGVVCRGVVCCAVLWRGVKVGAAKIRLRKQRCNCKHFQQQDTSKTQHFPRPARWRRQPPRFFISGSERYSSQSLHTTPHHSSAPLRRPHPSPHRRSNRPHGGGHTPTISPHHLTPHHATPHYTMRFSPHHAKPLNAMC